METTTQFGCDQCEAAMINGVFCHEIGCTNSGKRWVDGEWVRFIECFECGRDVREGESCNCQDDPVGSSWDWNRQGPGLLITAPNGETVWLQGEEADQLEDELDNCTTDEQVQITLDQYSVLLES